MNPIDRIDIAKPQKTLEVHVEQRVGTDLDGPVRLTGVETTLENVTDVNLEDDTPTNTGLIEFSNLDKNRTNVPLPKISEMLNRPFHRLMSQNISVPALFCEFVNKLGRWFSISDSVLALYNHPTGRLKIASWWDLHCFKEGVLMSLPTEKSILFEAVRSRRLLHKQVNGQFPGNYIEQRLMISKSTAALAVYPLVYKGVVNGVISLSSPVPFAFDMLEEGYFSAVFDKMASVVAERSPKEFWEPIFAAAEQDVYPAECRFDPLLKTATLSCRDGFCGNSVFEIEENNDEKRTLRIMRPRGLCHG